MDSHNIDVIKLLCTLNRRCVDGLRIEQEQAKLIGKSFSIIIIPAFNSFAAALPLSNQAFQRERVLRRHSETNILEYSLDNLRAMSNTQLGFNVASVHRKGL